MDDLIGLRLGQYEITALLGKGGMATVYRARQTSMERDVAIKIINPDLAASNEFITRRVPSRFGGKRAPLLNLVIHTSGKSLITGSTITCFI